MFNRDDAEISARRERDHAVAAEIADVLKTPLVSIEEALAMGEPSRGDGAVWVRIMQEGEDLEIHTMLHCASVIERLEPEQRKRVAQYLAVRFS